MSGAWRIDAADFTDLRLRALIDHHLSEMRGGSPADCAHALDASGLMAANIDMFVLSEDDRLLAMGALKRLDCGSAEIKSMRTHPDHLGRGAGRAVLDHLIEQARKGGARRISLETGSGPLFAPALDLYRRRGFRPGPAFDGYVATAFNQFFHLDLIPA